MKNTCKNSSTFEGKKILPEKVTYVPLAPSHSIVQRNFTVNNKNFKIHYGGLLLRLLRMLETRLTTLFPLQTSNRLRFRCTATGCSASKCLYKNGTFDLILLSYGKGLMLVSILHFLELGFASQLLLEPPVIPTTKQNNTL